MSNGEVECVLSLWGYDRVFVLLRDDVQCSTEDPSEYGSFYLVRQLIVVILLFFAFSFNSYGKERGLQMSRF